MLNGIIHAHSGFRWIVLILLVAATFKALLKWRSNAPFTEADRKLNFFTMLAAHLQLLLGLALYFMSDKVAFSGDTMKVAITRFFTAEHSLMMLVAIALITIGYTKSKKATEEALKFRTTFRYYLAALILVLAGIPWPFRGFGTGWF
jgi:hypothetical protein